MLLMSLAISVYQPIINPRRLRNSHRQHQNHLLHLHYLRDSKPQLDQDTRYSKPFETLQIKIPYTTGMNPYSGLVDMFEKQGLLKQSGNRLAWIEPETGEEFKFYRKEWKDDKLDMIMAKFHIKTEKTTTIPEEIDENVE